MKVALVGCGGAGHAHANDLKKLIESGADVEVACLVDVVREKALSVKRDLGFSSAEVLDDYRRAISLVDAAVICTPHTLHYQQVMDFLRAGKHVLVEKPMACKLGEAYRMMVEAERRDVVLEVAYQRHFMPKYVAAREFVRGGGLGEVKLISLLLAQNWYKIAKGTWRGTLKLGGGGELIDSGSHILDIAFWVSGLKPLEAFAYLDPYDIEVDVNACLSAKLTRGALLSFAVAGDSPAWAEAEMFWGERGRLVIGEEAPVFTPRGGEPRPVDTSGFKPSRPVFNFVDAVAGRDENKSPALCGLYVAALSEAAYESTKRGRPVSVKELCERSGVDYSLFAE